MLHCNSSQHLSHHVIIYLCDCLMNVHFPKRPISMWRGTQSRDLEYSRGMNKQTNEHKLRVNSCAQIQTTISRVTRGAVRRTCDGQNSTSSKSCMVIPNKLLALQTSFAPAEHRLAYTHPQTYAERLVCNYRKQSNNSLQIRG